MFSIVHGNALLQVSVNATANEISQAIESWAGLLPKDYYITQNGRPAASCFTNLLVNVPLRLNERIPGGKGGFGSMLRAIGAQIEKTTNREACRDLSGRRLRDINEEKRLKTYLEKQQEASEDERVKMQKKIDKLLSKPKHEFEDKEYEHQRSELVVETDEALQEGLQKVTEMEQHGPTLNDCSKSSMAGKRKLSDVVTAKSKKKKATLWLGTDDLSSSSETDNESEEGSVSSCKGKEKEFETILSLPEATKQQAPQAGSLVTSKCAVRSECNNLL